jgi:hypothetical protein
MTEKQAKPDKSEDYKVTQEINSILNAKDPIKALTDKNHSTQASFEVNADQDGVKNSG